VVVNRRGATDKAARGKNYSPTLEEPTKRREQLIKIPEHYAAQFTAAAATMGGCLIGPKPRWYDGNYGEQP
jgi:hypothetical protein